MLSPTTAVLLNHTSRDLGDVTVVLVELRWTSCRLHISSTAAIDYCPFPSKYCTQDIAVWKNVRKVRRSRFCSCRRPSLAILC